MSEKVKLIVTLSKGQYENLKDIQFGSIGSRMIFDAVKNGIPLDDVKSEIKQNYQEIDTVSHNEYENAVEQGKEIAYENVLSILDNIGKADMRGDKAE